MPSTTVAASTTIASSDAQNWRIILASQKLIEMRVDEYGGLVLRQDNWPDEDVEIYINGDYVDTFIDRLTDVLGVPSVGRCSS
jgi:hypothetical protein